MSLNYSLNTVISLVYGHSQNCLVVNETDMHVELKKQHVLPVLVHSRVLFKLKTQISSAKTFAP